MTRRLSQHAWQAIEQQKLLNPHRRLLRLEESAHVKAVLERGSLRGRDSKCGSARSDREAALVRLGACARVELLAPALLDGEPFCAAAGDGQRAHSCLTRCSRKGACSTLQLRLPAGRAWVHARATICWCAPDFGLLHRVVLTCTRAYPSQIGRRSSAPSSAVRTHR